MFVIVLDKNNEFGGSGGKRRECVVDNLFIV